MNCRELAQMIEMEARLVNEMVQNCDYVIQASYIRKHCIKIREDLLCLHKKLNKWNRREEFPELYAKKEKNDGKE